MVLRSVRKSSVQYENDLMLYITKSWQSFWQVSWKDVIKHAEKGNQGWSCRCCENPVTGYLKESEYVSI